MPTDVSAPIQSTPSMPVDNCQTAPDATVFLNALDQPTCSKWDGINQAADKTRLARALDQQALENLTISHYDPKSKAYREQTYRNYIQAQTDLQSTMATSGFSAAEIKVQYSFDPSHPASRPRNREVIDALDLTEVKPGVSDEPLRSE